MHVSDVNVILAQHSANCADDARPVKVPRQQEMPLGHKIDPQIIDTDDVRLVLEDRTPHQSLAIVVANCQRQQVFVAFTVMMLAAL